MLPRTYARIMNFFSLQRGTTDVTEFFDDPYFTPTIIGGIIFLVCGGCMVAGCTSFELLGTETDDGFILELVLDPTLEQPIAWIEDIVEEDNVVVEMSVFSRARLAANNLLARINGEDFNEIEADDIERPTFQP